MITLMVFACLIGTEKCRPLIVMDGFIHEKQCVVYSQLMVTGWAVQHPEVEVRRTLCTDKPEYIIGKYQS